MSRRDLGLLRGAIDMHAHTSPALFPRRISDHDLGRYALEYGMRGFVLKDHDSGTVHRAENVKRAMPGIDPIGSIVLNRSVGGINPFVVEAALQYGAKVIWMPSNHSCWHMECFGTPDYLQLGRSRPQLVGPGITILDDNGALTEEAKTIVALVADAQACLATGHLNLEEVRLLLDEANKVGLERFVITHCNWALTKWDMAAQKEFIAKGAYIEYVAITCVSATFHEQFPEDLAPWIDEHKGDRLILSSDLGQDSGPPHPEGLRMVLDSLLKEGIDYDVLEKMTTVNPHFLCGLD